MSEIKEDLNKIWNKIKADSTGEIGFFDWHDELIIPETSAGEGDAGPGLAYVTGGQGQGQGQGQGGGTANGNQYGVEDAEGQEGEDSIVHTSPEGDDEDFDNGGDDDGGDDGGDDDGDDDDGGDDDGGKKRKGKKKKKKKSDSDDDGDNDDSDDDDSDENDDDSEWEDNRSGKSKNKKPKKIRVGTKVRVRATGEERVVTRVNDDGTYVTGPVENSGGSRGAIGDIADVNEFARGGQVKVGNKYGDWSITQYVPVKYNDDGTINGGTIKLVNQQNFDSIIIQNDHALRGNEWYVRYKGVQIKDKNPKVVIEKVLNVTFANGGQTKLPYDREKYTKLLREYNKIGAFLDDAETKEEKDKYRKQLAEIESKLNRYERSGTFREGGNIGDVDSLTDELLSQKIKIFLDKVGYYKFYYVDDKTNTLYVGFADVHFNQDRADKVYKEATSSREFFDADGVESKVTDNGDTLFTIPIKRKVVFADGGKLDLGEGITIFNSGNEMFEMETTDFKGEPSDEPAWIPPGTEEKPPKSDDEGGDDIGGDDDDNIIHPPDPCLEVGTKVIIKATGQEGIITEVNRLNDDCTYVITPILKDGGEAGVGIHCASCDIVQTDIDLKSNLEVANVDADGNPSTDDDTYTRDEIEVIKDEDEDEDEDDGDDEDENTPPPPPKEFDIELYRGKINRIIQYKWKTPTFAKVFFKYSVSDSEFWEKSKLILLNRTAKDHLRYKRSTPMQSVDYLINMSKIQFPSFELYCQSNLIEIDNAYFLNRETPIEYLFAFNRIGEISRSEREMSSVLKPSINWIQETLDSGMVDEGFGFIISQVVKKLENYMVLDKNFYRILSLSAFYNPELYSNGYLKVHLNYMYSFYGEIALGFSNLKDTCFTSLALGQIFKGGTNSKINEQIIQDKLAQMSIRENMDVYTLIRDREKEDYQVYKSKNIRYNTEAPVISERFRLSEIGTGDTTKDIVQTTIEDFYGYCLLLKNNSTNKKQTLVNLQILSILQKESYKDFIRGLDILILKEYGI
jgi:hypothetical protein